MVDNLSLASFARMSVHSLCHTPGLRLNASRCRNALHRTIEHMSLVSLGQISQSLI